ncbi:hypothetical protein GN156_05495 [bacterium LRH843]|nr:hypothetical protein [bacterium LRH843]
MKTVKLAFILLSALFIVTGCNDKSSKSVSTNEELQSEVIATDSSTIEPLLYLYKNDEYDESIGSLYVIKGTNDIEKISGDVHSSSHKSIQNGNQLLYLDSEYNLYLVKDGEEREKLATNISYDFSFTPSGKGIVYMTDESELYLIKEGSERVKVASDVNRYEVLPDDQTIYVLSSENDLYRYNLEGEREKVAFDVIDYTLADEHTLIYTNKDQLLYYVDKTGERTKISNMEAMMPTIKPEHELIVFFEEYNFGEGYGELYMSDLKGERKRIASDVSNYDVSLDGKYIYYMNYDEKLLRYELKNEEKVELSKNVTDYSYTLDHKVVLIATEDGLYLKKGNEDKELLTTEFQEYFMFGDTAYYLDSEGALFEAKVGAEKRKIMSEVDSIHFDGNFLYYVTAEKVAGYVQPGKEETHTLVENARNYDYIFADDTFIFHNTAAIDDIVGYWHSTYYNDYYESTEHFIVKFEKKGNQELQIESLFPEQHLNTASLDYSESDMLSFSDEEEDHFSITILSEDEISVGDDYEEFNTFTRISKAEYDNLIAQFEEEAMSEEW